MLRVRPPSAALMKNKRDAVYLAAIGALMMVAALTVAFAFSTPSYPTPTPPPTTPTNITTTLAPYNLKATYPKAWELTGGNPRGDCFIYHLDGPHGTLHLAPICEGMDAAPDDCPDNYQPINESIVRYQQGNGITYSSLKAGACWHWVFVDSKPVRATVDFKSPPEYR